MIFRHLGVRLLFVAFTVVIPVAAVGAVFLIVAVGAVDAIVAVGTVGSVFLVAASVFLGVFIYSCDILLTAIPCV